MRLILLTVLGVLMYSCQQASEQAEEASEITSSEEKIGQETLEPYLFYIPGEYLIPPQDTLINVRHAENYFNSPEWGIEAKNYWDSDSTWYVALNRKDFDGTCWFYEALLLHMKESNTYEDVREYFFFQLNAYDFYTFEDRPLMQLEGDEETYFSGYRWDLSQDDELGIQFMFCNAKDSVNTYELNQAGKVIYYEF